MCFDSQNIKDIHPWNRDRDVIIHDSVVPASRWVVGYPETKEYSIDVREFLNADRNEIIKCTLQEEIKKYISEIEGDWELFTARKEKPLTNGEKIDQMLDLYVIEDDGWYQTFHKVENSLFYKR